MATPQEPEHSERTIDWNTEDSGGDPVCWLSRVCFECGRFSVEEPPTTCAFCGAEIEGD